MVTILNYGIGNVMAFYNIYTRLNIPVQIARSPEELSGATALILPGVGSFDWAMSRLNDSGLRLPVNQLVLEREVPLLGICVGMQMLARSSEEGEQPGLGYIDGEVKRLEVSVSLPLPHMGWNSVQPTTGHPLMAGLEAPRFYFLHSYYFDPAHTGSTMGITRYGEEFSSIVFKNHIFGVQFHPEKSHHWGVRLLKNFADLSSC